MLILALRNVFRHRFRTATTLAVVAFGVAGLVLTGGFVQDILVKLGEAVIHSQTGHLQISRPGFHEQRARKPDRTLIADPIRVMQLAAKSPEVDDAMARVSFSGLLSNGRSDLAIAGEGLDAEKEARLGTWLAIVAGRQLSKADKLGVLLGEGVASALKLKPGDRVTVVATTVDGATNSLDLDVVGIFQSYSKDYDARAIKVQLAAAQELLSDSRVNTIVVALKRTGDTTRIAEELRRQLGNDELEVSTWRELNDYYTKTVRLYETQFGVLRLIVLLMVLLCVVNIINMSIFERTPEFGTMRALGNRSRRVFGLVVTEALLLGLFGAVAGLAVSAALAWTVSAVGIPMPPPPNADRGYIAEIPLVPGVVLGALGVGIGATTLAGVLAATRVLKISLVDALRQSP